MILLTCLFACIPALGQKTEEFRASLSFDTVPVIADRTVRMDFHHSFSGKWSAGGGMSIQVPAYPETAAEDEEHRSMLAGGEAKKIAAPMRPEFRMGIRFWPQQFFEGCYIGISCFHSLSSGTDMEIEGGYAARIWGNLGISLGYELKPLECTESGKFGRNGFTICINYLL